MTTKRAFEPKLVTVIQALSILGIGRTKFYQLVDSRSLDIRKIGRRSMVTMASINSYVANLPRFGGNEGGEDSGNATSGLFEPIGNARKTPERTSATNR
jgi:hypothetical protein